MIHYCIIIPNRKHHKIFNYLLIHNFSFRRSLINFLLHFSLCIELTWAGSNLVIWRIRIRHKTRIVRAYQINNTCWLESKLLNHRLCELKNKGREKEWNNLITRHEKSFSVAPTCNYVKKNVDGIKQFSYLSALFYAFVGDLLFIVSWASPQWIILKQRRNQLPFDASMCSILISCWFSLMMMLWSGACSPTPMWSSSANKRRTWRLRLCDRIQ